MKKVQSITVSGALAGAAFTAPFPFLQRAGIYTAPYEFEILGYQSTFAMQADFSTLPFMFPTGALVYNINLPRITLPNNPVPNAPNQNGFFLAVLNALSGSQAAAAYPGSPAQIFGSASVAVMLPPGQGIEIKTGQSLSCYLSLAGVTNFNSAVMSTTLFINS